MNDLLKLVLDIKAALVIDIITALILGLLLFLIKVQSTAYTRKIAQTKNTIAVCFLICSILFYVCYKYSDIADFEVFSSMMMLVVTAISSVVLSFSLINLLDEKFMENDKFYLNVGVVAVFSIVFMRSFWWDHGWKRMVVHVVFIVYFLLQAIFHIISFRKAYKQSLSKLEQYYDEDEAHRLKWVHFCYVIMMLTQVFILVYRTFPTGVMKIYNLWYSLFLLYFAANFISFLGSHKLTLDAFAYKALSGQDMSLRKSKDKKDSENAGQEPESVADAEFKKLEKSLEAWVKQRKYVEYDKSREEVARELDTTRELLHLYFMTRMGMDFNTWRTALRVEEAKKLLLQNKNLSINVIAEMAGFSDRSNFHRQFVKLVGCSPKVWRDRGGSLPEA